MHLVRCSLIAKNIKFLKKTPHICLCFVKCVLLLSVVFLCIHMTVLCAFIVIAPALFSHSLPTYSEIVGSSAESEDERAVDEQEKFERKYNFRFEEPDSEFVSFTLVHSTCNMYMHFPYNLWYA